MTAAENSTDAIDIVLLWVDDKDPDWQARWQQYRSEEGEKTDEMSGLQRYRDWGTLRYVLRSIERFAPWYHRIYLVTCGQTPQWLATDHPKLVCLSHEAFFAYTSHLPTFNSNAIQVNIPNIKGLAEQYLIWDDDMIATHPLQPTDFFRDGLPVKPVYWGCFMGRKDSFEIACTRFFNELRKKNGRIFTCDYFKKARRLKNLPAWLYNLLVFELALLTGKKMFPGGYCHMPWTMLKSDVLEHFAMFPEKTKKTSASRFRTMDDMMVWSHSLISYAKGRFLPASKLNRLMFLEDHMQNSADFTRYDRYKYESWLSYRITRLLLRRHYAMLCIQDHTTDMLDIQGQARIKEALAAYLDSLFPQPSAFEKKEA